MESISGLRGMETGSLMIKNLNLAHWVTQSKFSGSKTAKSKNLVALSFDDGPHYLNTLSVIKTLNDNNAQATFFWIVENAIDLAKRHPLLLKKIISEIRENNHEIGLHAPYDFKPTLSSRFFGHFSKYEFQKSKNDLEHLTEMKIQLYRPHNVQLGSSILYAKELGMVTVIGDILRFTKPNEEVYIQVKRLSFAKPGSILLLHDGVSFSQKINHILKVLPKVVKVLKNKGLKLTSVSNVLKN